MTEETSHIADEQEPPSVPADEQAAAHASTEDAQAGSAVGESAPQDAGDAGPRTKEAWRDVLTQIDALGESIGRWAKAAVNDPENRRHASEIRDKLDAVGAKIGSAFDEATQTDIGRKVADAADKTGKTIVDVSGKVAEEAAPAVASALSGLAGLLGKAAERVGQAAERPAATVATGDEDVPADAEASAGDSAADAPAEPRAGE